MKLWEANHRYYCNLGNYYAPGNDQPVSRYKSFSDFLAEFGDADIDYNHMIRWDWYEGEDYGLPEFNGDINYRNGVLYIFWLFQRKGIYAWSEIEICRADEPQVKVFLQKHWEYMKDIWNPIS